MSDVENRRAEFLRLIRDYSESRYRAGWASGIEEQIREEGGLWVFMAFGAGGWPLGYEGEEGWVPLSDSEVTLVTSMTRLILEEQMVERYGERDACETCGEETRPYRTVTDSGITVMGWEHSSGRTDHPLQVID